MTTIPAIIDRMSKRSNPALRGLSGDFVAPKDPITSGVSRFMLHSRWMNASGPSITGFGAAQNRPNCRRQTRAIRQNERAQTEGSDACFDHLPLPNDVSGPSASRPAEIHFHHVTVTRRFVANGSFLII